MSRPVLAVAGLSVRYGGNLAVTAVDLEVCQGEIVGLIGANGAGKTTTIDAICGFVPHTGSVAVVGTDMSSARPHARARAGLARTWQSVELFEDLTVRQNCEVAARPGGARQLFGDVIKPRRSGRDEGLIDESLALVGLGELAPRMPTELSHGQRKLAGVARALSGSPRVLLLDEPAAGLDRQESRLFGSMIRSVVDDRGLSALLVDHDTRLVFDVCDRVYALDFGIIVACGTPDEVRSDPRVVEAYLGVSESSA